MNNENIKYAAQVPYPEIKILTQNSFYSEVLMNDYSGHISEMTAINQYIYHHFVTEDKYKNIKTLFEEVAIVEMKHLEILAETIKLLGGNPIFREGYSPNKYWNGGLVQYGTNVLERLKSDLQSEYNAINNYKKDLNIIKDPYIQRIISRIILDEEVHAELFKNAINNI